MSRIRKYLNTTKVTAIRLVWEDEKYLFNLISEVAIKKENLRDELTTQPKIYAFIGVLHKKYISKVKDLELDRDKTYAERYIYHLTSEKAPYFIKYKMNPNATLAKSYTEKDPAYVAICREVIKAEESKNILETCVKAFEQRASLLQTLSANERNEKYN